MSGHPEGTSELTREALERRLSEAEHAVIVLRRLAFALKELVPKAFEEGFRARAPDVEEPWLVDWLQSDTKRALEPLVTAGRRQGAGPE